MWNDGGHGELGGLLKKLPKACRENNSSVTAVELYVGLRSILFLAVEVLKEEHVTSSDRENDS